MKNLLYAIGIIVVGALLMLIVLPLDIVDEIRWRLSK